MVDRLTHINFDPNNLIPVNQIKTDIEFSVSPPVRGNLYEISQVFDDKGIPYALKTLRPDLIQNKKYPSVWSLEDIFEIHIREHMIFVKHLSDFIPPTHFVIQQNKDGNKSYKVIQPWVSAGVQFKEAIVNNREIPPYQMPDLFDRLRLVRGICELLRDKDVHPKIGDFDFFLTDSGKRSRIVMIDTNFLWHPKHVHDRMHVAYHLMHFLFSKQEKETVEIRDLDKQVDQAFQINSSLE